MMKPKTFYLLFCLIGLLAPYAAFVPWLLQHSLDLRVFVQQMFANRISTFFSLDVIVSAIVLLRFAAAESVRLRIPRRWLILLATLLVGVSLGLPLLLYLRESQLESHPAAA